MLERVVVRRSGWSGWSRWSCTQGRCATRLRFVVDTCRDGRPDKLEAAKHPIVGSRERSAIRITPHKPGCIDWSRHLPRGRQLFPNPIPESTTESVSFLKRKRAPAWLEGVMPSKPQHYVIEMHMVGGRGGTRTRGPLLAKIGRTKNQQLIQCAMKCYRLLQVQRLEALSVAGPTLGSTQ